MKCEYRYREDITVHSTECTECKYHSEEDGKSFCSWRILHLISPEELANDRERYIVENQPAF
jgi:hypothetical protein